jgi:mitochondrial import receptor subunit TOM40
MVALLLRQGKDWNGQLKWGTSNFYGANYFQSVTPSASVGGEVFYLAEQRRRWVPVCVYVCVV